MRNLSLVQPIFSAIDPIAAPCEGDIVWVDFSASYNRYHADLARIFSIGEPDRRWTDLYENVFDIVIEDWPGGKGGSYIEMLLMTEHGLEILSKLDRRLIVV